MSQPLTLRTDAGDEHLDLSEFVFKEERPASPPSQRGLWLVIAALSAGFLAASALATYLYYLLIHAR